MSFTKLGEVSSQAAFLKEHYGLDTDGFPADQIAALHDLADGGRTSGDDMKGLYNEVLSDVTASRAAALATLAR
jgi:hypothetical protein